MKKTKAKNESNELDSRKELLDAIEIVSATKGISKEVLIDTIKNAMLAACKNEFSKSENNQNGNKNNNENNEGNNSSNKIDNIRVNVDTEKGIIDVVAMKTIVEKVNDKLCEISMEEAEKLFPNKVFELGDVVNIMIPPKDLMRISAHKAKQAIIQKIKEEERKYIYSQYLTQEHEIISGVVQRIEPKRYTLNLGKIDAFLPESEQIPGEKFALNQRIRAYVVEVKSTSRDPRIIVSRSDKEFVVRLFEEQVTEIKDGIVEIKSVAREAGYRTKIAVYSNDEDVDPLGSCVGLNGDRVNTIVDELNGEKIDIIKWDYDPEVFIENALSPAKVISVTVDPEIKLAKVIVPDAQLSLAIGREGQNSRLAAKLTGYKIDIKPESQQDEDEYEVIDDDDIEYSSTDNYPDADDYSGNDSFSESDNSSNADPEGDEDDYYFEEDE